MKQNLTILFYILTLVMSCNTKQTNSKEFENCLFEFKIDQESSFSYKYNSKTEILSKLIDPYGKDPLYADTLVRIPEKELCKLMALYVNNEIFDYPDHFTSKTEIEINPEPSYLLRFVYKGKVKEIRWKSNTIIYQTVEAANLNKIIHVIDSLILSTPEFKALPEGKYEWL